MTCSPVPVPQECWLMTSLITQLPFLNRTSQPLPYFVRSNPKTNSIVSNIHSYSALQLNPEGYGPYLVLTMNKPTKETKGAKKYAHKAIFRAAEATGSDRLGEVTTEGDTKLLQQRLCSFG